VHWRAWRAGATLQSCPRRRADHSGCSWARDSLRTISGACLRRPPRCAGRLRPARLAPFCPTMSDSSSATDFAREFRFCHHTRSSFRIAIGCACARQVRLSSVSRREICIGIDTDVSSPICIALRPMNFRASSFRISLETTPPLPGQNCA